MSDILGLRSLYGHIASRYEQNVIPAFGPLADDLAHWITHCVHARLHYHLYDPFDLDDETLNIRPVRSMNTLVAADIGTGTGILARLLASGLHTMIGIDVSAPMLKVAAEQSFGQDNLSFIVADLHRLPFRPGGLQLIVSSFGLNASTPKKAMQTFAGILRRGEGMLAFQEWGVQDDASALIDEVLHEYTPETIPGLDEALQTFHAHRKPWYDHLQDTEDYYDLLKQVGFENVWVKEAPFATVSMPSIDTFLDYKLSWPLRHLTLQAMSPSARADFDAQVHVQLAQFTNADGSFDWTPSLFRVFAIR